MKVLFIQDVPGTAYAGDLKAVKDGFARNYLLPRKLAVLATPDQMNRVAGLQAAAAKRRDATEVEMAALAEKLDGMTVTIEGRAGRNDRLYGSVTNIMVAEELSKAAGQEIDRRRIILEPIRQLGAYEVPIKLYQGIEPRVTVVVTAPGRTAAPVEDAEEGAASAEEAIAGAAEETVAEESEAPLEEAVAAAPKPRRRARAAKEPVAEEAEAPMEEPVAEAAEEAAVEEAPKPRRRARAAKEAADEEAEAPVEEPVAETTEEAVAEESEEPVEETAAEADEEEETRPSE